MINLIISIPKSGTGLIANIVRYLTNCPRDGFIRDLDWEHANEQRLEYLKSGIRHENATYTTHCLYDTKVLSWLLSRRGLGLNTIFVYRDPRDVLVSGMHYVINMIGESHPVYPIINTSDPLLTMIEGVGNRKQWSPTDYPNIRIHYDLFTQWRDNIFPIRYEDIISTVPGVHARGATHTVRQLAAYLGVPYCPEALPKALSRKPANKFRVGKVGSWRDEFKPHHTKAFNRVAPNLLHDLGY